jgi:DNA-directed RNA polymerase specialized sigma24 family protein
VSAAAKKPITVDLLAGLQGIVEAAAEESAQKTAQAFLAELRSVLGSDRAPARSAVEHVYVSRAEAAVRMGYHVSTVTRLIKAGLLKASGPHRDRIRVDEIDRFMEESAKRGGAAVSEADEVSSIVDSLLEDDE